MMQGLRAQGVTRSGWSACRQLDDLCDLRRQILGIVRFAHPV